MDSVGSAPPVAAPSAPAPRRRLPAWVEVPALMVAALLVAVLVKTFVAQAFFIPSGSMEQTLLVGDRVIVSKVDYRVGPVERGDIVVFDGTGSFAPRDRGGQARNPLSSALSEVGQALGVASPDERIFIKRVIGVGGDRVACCDRQGRITVNGEPLEEGGYLNPGDSPSDDEFSVVVPPGRLWVMGDHRSASADSRAHLGDPGGGMVPVSRVLGRAVAVVWPLDRLGGL